MSVLPDRPPQQKEPETTRLQKSLDDTPTRPVPSIYGLVFQKEKIAAAVHAASRLDFFTKSRSEKSPPLGNGGGRGRPRPPSILAPEPSGPRPACRACHLENHPAVALTEAEHLLVAFVGCLYPGVF